MHSRLLPLFGLSLVILTACGGPTTVSYRLTFNSTDPATVDELSKATIRVAQRRLDTMGADLSEQKVTKDADGVTLQLSISNAGAAKALTDQLTTPFDLQIMQGTTDTAHADVTVEGFGAFVKTNVTGADLVSVIAATNPETKGGAVKINFTPDGLKKMQTLFKNNVGKSLGLFVRGKLVSALTVKTPTMPNPLVIDGVPDPELAQIFADDVNVGTHVTVTPL